MLEVEVTAGQVGNNIRQRARRAEAELRQAGSPGLDAEAKEQMEN